MLGGLLAAALTTGVYAAEDAFHKLPIHWMWWPAIGGIFIGLGGLIFPQALGVGYDTIGSLLQGEVPMRIVAGVLLVKSAIWMISLGSGTSGGVLAPLFMMGAALGGLEATFLPHLGAGFWPLVSMAAVLAGTVRAPFTAIVFALELTHDVNILLPLLIAATLAHGATVLLLKRSILTEKVARRGFHLSAEYAIDPLEILSAREVMRTNVAALPMAATLDELRASNLFPAARGQHLFPVIDAGRRVTGVVTRADLSALLESSDGSVLLGGRVRSPAVAARESEPLRVVVSRMAESGFTRMPVLRDGSGEFLGMISVSDLLAARVRNLAEERERQRVLCPRIV